MKTNRLRLVVEDRCTEQFLRSYLQIKGFDRRQLNFKIAPRGAGAADRWVIDHVGRNARDWYSVLSFQAQLGYVIAIDGDDVGLIRRKEAVEAALSIPRKPAARIAILVPCRNIETWLHVLSGKATDESTDYKNSVDAERGCGLDQDGASAIDRSNLPSLTDARSELRRLY